MSRIRSLVLLACCCLGILAQENKTSNSSKTGCGDCCAPGGSCAYAYKETPGICCGLVGPTPFCCPGAGSSYGQATCDQAGATWRCRPGASPSRPSHNGGRGRSSTSDGWWGLWGLILPLACLGLCIYSCVASRRAYASSANVAAVPMQSVATGYPGYPQQQPQPASQPQYGAQPLYQPTPMGGSGVSPWLAGGGGLLGGVLLGEALADRHGYGGGYGGYGAGWDGGGWGGRGVGGGDFAAGTDSGGGGGMDGTFAADS